MTPEQQPSPMAEIITENWIATKWNSIKNFFQKYIIGIIIFSTITVALYIYFLHDNAALVWNIAAASLELHSSKHSSSLGTIAAFEDDEHELPTREFATVCVMTYFYHHRASCSISSKNEEFVFGEL